MWCYVVCIHQILVLIATGFVGGIFSSFAGSGLDICSFSVITLLFRVTEKTATPTSVVLMAGNTVIGTYWRQVCSNIVFVEALRCCSLKLPISASKQPQLPFATKYLQLSFVWTFDVAVCAVTLVVYDSLFPSWWIVHCEAASRTSFSCHTNKDHVQC